MSDEVVVVVGLGEVGRPLFDILTRAYECVGVDIQPVEVRQPCSVLHICIPFQISDFTGSSCELIARYRPRYTVINSTVAPGTTRAIAARSGTSVVYSPVRGKHTRMREDMLYYRKFVGADDPAAADAIVRHYAGAGFRTDRFRSSVAGELAKLLETTWLGALVGWAQEAERLALTYGLTYDEVDAYIEEISFLPHVFPGVIGGHCVMPNIAILRAILQSDFLDAIVKGNALKAERLQLASENTAARA